MRLRVPGNVLLAGEYTVLERGGLGLCMAVDQYVELDAAPGEPTSADEAPPDHLLVGVMGGEAVVWTAGRASEDPLFSALVRECGRVLDENGFAFGPPLRITVDSSAHHYGDGRKRGLGSSAAVSVAIAALLLRPLEGRSEYPTLVFRTALAAHRAVQGGRGSGYDVAVSTFGGIGLFTGGPEPTYERLAEPPLPYLTLMRGPAPVSTVSAVEAYENWKRLEGDAARRHHEASNLIVRSLIEAADAVQFVVALDRAAELGLRLGESIGVSAEPDEACAQCRDEATGVKALGAGNELILAYSLLPMVGPALRPAAGGFEWIDRQ